jgi:hypothetical protein
MLKLQVGNSTLLLQSGPNELIKVPASALVLKTKLHDLCAASLQLHMNQQP